VENGKSSTRIVVADDHPVFRSGLVNAIDQTAGLELVGQAESGRRALELIRELEPEVAVIDLKMPELDGIQVMRAVAADGVATRILFLSGYLQSTAVYRAIEAGAQGYLSKDSDPDSICRAIVAVAAGATVLSPEVQRSIGEEIRLRAPASPASLSEREREILVLTAEGQSASDIGERLFLSPATVKTHLQRVYQKLGVSDRASAVAEAMRAGILD
jgi:two-component system, NarL family, nitrate/nitrite response regulator NarL